MSLLIPAGMLDAPRGKIALTSVATSGSNSIAAAGTNLVQVPFFMSICASSAGGSYTVYNGTGGSILWQGIVQVGVQEFNYWTNPGDMAANKGLVIETAPGIGKGEFHVYFVVTRGGAPQTPLNQ